MVRKVYVIDGQDDEGYRVLPQTGLGEQPDILGQLEKVVGRFKGICLKCADQDYLEAIHIEYDKLQSKLVNAIGNVPKINENSTEKEKEIFVIKYSRIFEIQKEIRVFESVYSDVIDLADVMSLSEKIR